DLLAKYMPFDLVIDEQTADGQQARVSKSSMCGTWGAIAGELRYFADRFGVPRASIEGTQIRLDRLRRFARREPAELDYSPRRKHAPLVLNWRIEYFGFVLEHGNEPIRDFPPDLIEKARRVLAEALARADAKHVAVHKNRDAIDEVREMYRRSAGKTPRLGQTELADWYEARLIEQNIKSLHEFQKADLFLEVEDFVPAAQRQELKALPSRLRIHKREVEIHYDVEERPVENGLVKAKDVKMKTTGVARLQLPEKLARSLSPDELPRLDRPLRFVVTRGQRGAVRADTLEELQEMLEGPWTPNEAPDGDWRGAEQDSREGTNDGHARGHRRGTSRNAGTRSGDTAASRAGQLRRGRKNFGKSGGGGSGGGRGRRSR
ncbi:MAG TPA: hypothetical protein VF719_04025, partial [Abditibacteriaceae bacterium]